MNPNGKISCPTVFKGKRERQPNWTESEKQFLLILTKRHRAILENKGSDSKTIKRKSDAWDDIASNMDAAGYHRTKERLKQQFGRIRSAEAKKAKNALQKDIPSGSTSSDSSVVGSPVNEKEIFLKEYENGLVLKKSEPQRNNSITYSNHDAFIKIEKATSIDDFEEQETGYEKEQLVPKELTSFLEYEKFENKSLVEAGNIQNDKHQCFDKIFIQNNSQTSSGNCKVTNLQMNRKFLFARNQRILQLHKIRIAIERERLMALRLQRKRDNLLYQKDMQIQNMKMQILQNLINPNRNNHINL